jgi:hypothetical protein
MVYRTLDTRWDQLPTVSRYEKRRITRVAMRLRWPMSGLLNLLDVIMMINLQGEPAHTLEFITVFFGHATEVSGTAC